MIIAASLGATITSIDALAELARSAHVDPLEVVLNTVAVTVHRVAASTSGCAEPLPAGVG